MSDLESKREALIKARTEEFAKASPSKVIQMALDDMEQIEKDDRYVVHMDGLWHQYGPDAVVQSIPQGICAVCAAGACMSVRLGVPFGINAIPGDPRFEWSREVNIRLQGLDFFRRGLVWEGVRKIMSSISTLSHNPNVPTEMFVCPYGVSRHRFKDDMQRMSRMLARAGF
jgi:hypothetical protein